MGGELRGMERGHWGYQGFVVVQHEEEFCQGAVLARHLCGMACLGLGWRGGCGGRRAGSDDGCGLGGGRRIQVGLRLGSR